MRTWKQFPETIVNQRESSSKQFSPELIEHISQTLQETSLDAV